jgi:hypothetical protein
VKLENLDLTQIPIFKILGSKKTIKVIRLANIGLMTLEGVAHLSKLDELNLERNNI